MPEPRTPLAVARAVTRLSAIRITGTFSTPTHVGRTMIGLRALFAGFLFVSAAVAPSGAAAPSMAVNWVEISGDQDACMKQATNSVKRNNFGTRFEVLNNRTLYGERGDYTAAVRCVADKSIAFVAVAGPKADMTEKYAQAIKDGF
jgi:hypothetical protein